MMHEEGRIELERDVEDGWVLSNNPDGGTGDGGEMMDIDSIGGQKVQVIQSKTEQKKEEVFDLDDLSDEDDNMFAKPEQ